MCHQDPSGELVLVGVFVTRHDAELARSVLEARGIATVVIADDFAGLQPALSASQGVRLLVARRHAEESTRLLG